MEKGMNETTIKEDDKREAGLMNGEHQKKNRETKGNIGSKG
jgi:hypothetical protein